MKRLDSALVELGLVPSRSKAQQMIAAGEVEVEVEAQDHDHDHDKGGVWKVILQASYRLRAAQKVRLHAAAQTLKYVSRGGFKLEAALAHTGIKAEGLSCLDLGLSTGGFSDCLLQSGAREVTGYDVGHDQLSEKLRFEPKLRQFEGVNVRNLKLDRSFDLCVVDLSFISLQLIIPVLERELRTAGTKLLALVKPQFEVGPDNLGKNGIVQDSRLFADVQEQVMQALKRHGFSVLDYFACAVKGQDGNQEFFTYAVRN